MSTSIAEALALFCVPRYETAVIVAKMAITAIVIVSSTSVKPRVFIDLKYT